MKMLKKGFKTIVRRTSDADRKRHAEIRAKVMQEFPPKDQAVALRNFVAVRLEPEEAKIISGIAKSKGVRNADVVHEWIRKMIKAS
ncbi:MAG TPA: hypothetical protein VKX17_05685 [Planctomycetota bacterium]|nr:hypothetical protein [Planctomycetota bacterium]